jgi:SAM-dependent methyltransferase
VHDSVMRFVREQVRQLDLSNRAVVEIGSYDVNGSVRSLFTGPYIGLDMEDGPGVDIVGHSTNLPFENDSAPVVVSTEVLEHDPRPWLSIAEMGRILAVGGHLILTARGYDERGCFQVHRHPEDYWRFSIPSFRVMIEDAGLTVLDLLPDPQAIGVFATAIKHGVT